MNVTRSQYIVHTNQPKTGGEQLSQDDLIKVGYMAGRYGINLDGKQWKHKVPVVSTSGTRIDINSCTSDLFEENLSKAGIKFNKLA